MVINCLAICIAVKLRNGVACPKNGLSANAIDAFLVVTLVGFTKSSSYTTDNVTGPSYKR